MLSVDLHSVFRDERAMNRAIREAIFRAAATGEDALEIIPGRGSGQLKRRVLAQLRNGTMRRLYRTVESDPTNEGRIIVRFK